MTENIQKTKNILRNYNALLLEEKQLREQLEIWEARAVSVNRAPDGMPRGSGVSDPTALHAVKITEIKSMLIRKQREISEALLVIENLIESLPQPFYRYIMREYYINNKKWQQIATESNYSIHHLWRLHSRALKELRAL